MFITCLYLKGYKRLLLRGIEEFRITPTEIQQLIIGTNGSGKSSVLDELSPLPAFSGDYTKGGGKVIKLSHRGHNYVLTSFLELGSKHSFLMDEEELNPGGTSTVQKELVFSHFGNDNELHDVLTGRKRFTNMPALKRRDWIMRLSGNDMQFSITLFSKLKSKARDQVGVLKHLAKRLADEMEKLPTEEELDRLSNQAMQLKEELNFLMENREPNLPSVAQATQSFDEMVEQLRTLSNRVLRYSAAPMPRIEGLTLESIETHILEHEREAAAHQARVDTMQEECERVSRIVSAMRESNAKTLEELEARIATLRWDCTVIWENIPEDYRVESSADVLLSRTTALAPVIQEILNEIPSAQGRDFSQAERDSYLNEHNRLLTHIQRLKEEISQIEHRIRHIETAKNATCPQCKFSWIPGVGDMEKPELEARKEGVVKDLEQSEKDLEATAEWLEENAVFRDAVRRLNSLVAQHRELWPLWRGIASRWSETGHAVAAIPVITQWHAALQLCSRVENMRKEIERDENALNLAKQHTDDTNESRLAELEQNISMAIDVVTYHRNAIKSLQAFRSSASVIEKAKKLLEDKTEEVSAKLGMVIRAQRVDLINQMLSVRHSQLAQAENALNNARASAAVVEEIKRSNEKAKADLAAFNVLVEELSPTEGLIADQLKGFMNCFVEQMNAVIEQVWTYPLHVLPCGIESEEMDYLFPLSVNNDALVSKDIAYASASQIDIVDLAFVLVVMLYLNLDDYPLFLDEVGTSMDEQHRFNLIAFIKQFVETKRCSQLWMISHYATQHGAFVSAEVCVMDGANIVVLPNIYNRHVYMR